MSVQSTLEAVKLLAPRHADQDRVLTPEALRFIVELHRRFNPRRLELLAARAERQKRLDAGEKPDFLPETKKIRESAWTVAPIPADLLDRRVEITGPVGSQDGHQRAELGRQGFHGGLRGRQHSHLDQPDRRSGQPGATRFAARITYTDPASGKEYKLNEKTAVLLVRPRGWHLNERHVLVDGQPMSGSMFDFALYFFHNAKELLARGSGPYFYLPKMESHLEARLWNDIFIHAQEALGVPHGTIGLRC